MARSTLVIDNKSARRYELRADEAILGFIQYHCAGQWVTLIHTEIDPTVNGRGYGSQLVRGALEDLRQRGASVLVACPFIKSWLATHRDFDDLDLHLTPDAPGA